MHTPPLSNELKLNLLTLLFIVRSNFLEISWRIRVDSHSDLRYVVFNIVLIPSKYGMNQDDNDGNMIIYHQIVDADKKLLKR